VLGEKIRKKSKRMQKDKIRKKRLKKGNKKIKKKKPFVPLQNRSL
jgi:hypothetical protein